MDLADRFGMAVLTFVDTSGAYPGAVSEERGIAEAIARATERGLTLGVPMITVIAGEGQSGGAIGLAAANVVLVLEHGVYSVISPEGCAAILWRDRAKASSAADALKITAEDLIRHRIVDGGDPRAGRRRACGPGGAHAARRRRGRGGVAAVAGEVSRELRRHRAERFYAIGRAGADA
jgi:acetyl-CoA carboxylase carboxyl transferase subunit alpha